jgi:mannonate dehydratase
MRRRDVFQSAALAAAASLEAQGAPAKPRGAGKPVLMKVGTQNADDEENLTAFAAFGVNNICSTLPSRKLDEAWSVEGLTKLRERVEKHGIKLDMVPLPLSSAYITRAEYPAIMRGESPERDKNIDDVCQMIRNIAKAGIPAAKYNMSILGVVRTEPTKGRGGAMYSTFKYAIGKQEPALTEAGPVDPDAYWERITYFLERVVPVAAEYKVKIACHPNDPGMPNGKKWRGVVPVLGRVEGLKRFVTIKENPYHGLNFCQGTVCEGLENPDKEIHDVIRWFGSRKKIFNVHFRNIEGRIGDFRETFPDNGDVNMIEAIRTYREVGYDGMIMPDHVPRVAGDTRGGKSFAFCFGYIQALIQMLKMEG